MKNNFFKTAKLSSRFIISLSALFLLFFAFEARADLVEDLTKKYKLDPKNNPKDQCELMFRIQKMIHLKELVGPNCKENICSISFDIYDFDEEKRLWYGFIQMGLIYYKDSLVPIGMAMEREFYSEMSVKDLSKFSSENYIKEKGMIYLTDVHYHKKFRLLRQQFPNNKFDNGSLNMVHTNSLPKNASYIKRRLCHVNEFFIKLIDNNSSHK
jgi:hypothetical protein